MKRICFLIYNLEPGGLQKFLLRFIERYSAELDISIIVKSKRNNQLLQSFVDYPVSVVIIPSGYLNVLAWFKIYRFFKAGAFETACELSGNFSGVYLMLAKSAGVKTTIAKYGLGSNHFHANFWNDLYNRAVKKLVFHYSDYIVFNSVAALEFFFPDRSPDDKRFLVIKNEISASEYKLQKNVSLLNTLGIDSKKFVIGNISRLDKKKNIESVLDVAEKLLYRKEHFHFIIAGFHTELLQTEINERGLNEIVCVLGYRSDIPEVINAFDIFYFPSITEGQPNVIVECLLSGIPVVASNLPEIKAIVPEVLHPFLVDPMDVESASGLIEFLYENPYPMSGDEIRNWAVKHLSYDNQANRFINLIR